MPWNDIARAQHTRKTDRYPSDMSDDEWSLVEPMIPPHGLAVVLERRICGK